jgi:hypothetical protein
MIIRPFERAAGLSFNIFSKTISALLRKPFSWDFRVIYNPLQHFYFRKGVCNPDGDCFIC